MVSIFHSFLESLMGMLGLHMHVVFLNILIVNITFMVYNIYFALITEVNPRDL